MQLYQIPVVLLSVASVWTSAAPLASPEADPMATDPYNTVYHGPSLYHPSPYLQPIYHPVYTPDDGPSYHSLPHHHHHHEEDDGPKNYGVGAGKSLHYAPPPKHHPNSYKAQPVYHKHEPKHKPEPIYHKPESVYDAPEPDYYKPEPPKPVFHHLAEPSYLQHSEPVYKPKSLVYKPEPYKRVGVHHHHHDEYKHEPKPYAFDYGVKDKYTGANFGHSEKSDGKNVEGSYSVALPDGRIQHVKYVADHYNGFQAEVTYEGEAHFPEYHHGGYHHGPPTKHYHKHEPVHPKPVLHTKYSSPYH